MQSDLALEQRVEELEDVVDQNGQWEDCCYAVEEENRKLQRRIDHLVATEQNLMQCLNEAQLEVFRLRQELQRLYNLTQSDREDYIKCGDVADITGTALELSKY